MKKNCILHLRNLLNRLRWKLSNGCSTEMVLFYFEFVEQKNEFQKLPWINYVTFTSDNLNFLPSNENMNFCYMPNYNYCVISTKHKTTNCSDWVIIRYKFFVQVWVVVNESCNKINFFFWKIFKLFFEHISYYKYRTIRNSLKIW